MKGEQLKVCDIEEALSYVPDTTHIFFTVNGVPVKFESAMVLRDEKENDSGIVLNFE